MSEQMSQPGTNEPAKAGPLKVLPLATQPMLVLSLDAQVPLQINYADAALRKRMSRLSAASCIVAACGVPATVAAAISASSFTQDLGEIAGAVTFFAMHLTCLGLGLWANSLIKQLKGRVADVVMAGIGIAIGSVGVGVPVLLILGMLLMGAWR